MKKKVPTNTIQALARSIYKEASSYGFGQLDMISLVNELMDYCGVHSSQSPGQSEDRSLPVLATDNAGSLPIVGSHLKIRAFDPVADTDLLKIWLPDKYGRYFVLSSTASQSLSIDELIVSDKNRLAIITTLEDHPIGALAYLNYDKDQSRAELRKLIGDPAYRGKGHAEEATRLWIAYGLDALKLEKIYVSTLQTHISNIKLNEKIGFQVEGLLRDEVLIDGARHDVLRMGFLPGMSQKL